MKDLNITIACSVGWGASYLLRSYYDGDISSGNLEIQNRKMDLSRLQIFAVDHYILEDYNLGNEDFAYVGRKRRTTCKSLATESTGVD